MIYIIDHQDSFTWNVVHQFAKFDKVICSNYYEVKNKLLDKIIIYSSGLILGANGTPIFAKIFDEATAIEQFPRFHLKKDTKLQNNIESVWDCNP